MMLIFEEIQINTSDGVYQKPLPHLPRRYYNLHCWDDFHVPSRK